MLGTLLNVAAIVIGTIAGLIAKGEMRASRQLFLKVAIGVALVWHGLKIAFSALTSGDGRYFAKLFLILLVAMIAGRLLGRLLRLQAGLNRLGQFAKGRIGAASQNATDGALAAVVLFCAAPLGVVGAIEDGLANRYEPLLIKGAIDGLAAFSFARMFGPAVAASAVPVALLQGAIAFGVRAAVPWLAARQLTDPIHVVAGFLLLYISMIVFELKKVELGDYLPAMAVAPALAWLFR